MEAGEIIPATRRLEHSGMTRNEAEAEAEAEAVIGELQKVVAPLVSSLQPN